jgi:hypothetical protein
MKQKVLSFAFHFLIQWTINDTIVDFLQYAFPLWWVTWLPVLDKCFKKRAQEISLLCHSFAITSWTSLVGHNKYEESQYSRVRLYAKTVFANQCNNI